MGTFAFVLGVTALTVAVLGTLGYFAMVLHEDHIARALRDTGITPNAAPEPSTPPLGVPGRALTDLQQCYRKGHLYTEWARTKTHWVCVRCGDQVKLIHDDLPFDQEAAELVAEAEQWLRRAS